MQALGAILTLITIIFTRYMVAKYGENSRIIIVTVALCISIIGLVGIIYSRKYLAVLWALLIFILIPIAIKVVKIKN
ncbi:MAG: hypothetical protein RR636_06690 [Clostridium sp.]|uniref:hypothetical protein n=1 Tax=Clostridium sp. TaxID=1506 RepID=UPI003061E7CB